LRKSYYPGEFHELYNLNTFAVYSAVAAFSQILLYLCGNFALCYGCALVISNIVSRNHNTSKT